MSSIKLLALPWWIYSNRSLVNYLKRKKPDLKKADRKYLITRTYKNYKAFLLKNPDTFVVQMDTVYNYESDGTFIQIFKFVRSGLLFALYHTKKNSFYMLIGVELLDSILGGYCFKNISSFFSRTKWLNFQLPKRWRTERTITEEHGFTTVIPCSSDIRILWKINISSCVTSFLNVLIQRH